MRSMATQGPITKLTISNQIQLHLNAPPAEIAADGHHHFILGMPFS